MGSKRDKKSINGEDGRLTFSTGEPLVTNQASNYSGSDLFDEAPYLDLGMDGYRASTKEYEAPDYIFGFGFGIDKD